MQNATSLSTYIYGGEAAIHREGGLPLLQSNPVKVKRGGRGAGLYDTKSFTRESQAQNRTQTLGICHPPHGRRHGPLLPPFLPSLRLGTPLPHPPPHTLGVWLSTVVLCVDGSPLSIISGLCPLRTCRKPPTPPHDK